MRRVLLLLLTIIPLSACLAPGPTPGVFPSDAWFVRIGQCEQPADTWWTGGVDWTIHGPGYEGGLGFAVSTWDAYRDDTMPDNAGDATPAQQFIVARRVFEDVGASAWGCDSVAGEPY